MRAARIGAAMIMIAGGMFGGSARADTPPEPSVQAKLAAKPREIRIEVPGERSRTNQIVLASVAGAGVLVGALGLYFNLDARSASNDVSSGRFTGEPWTQEQVDLVDRADRSSTRAAIAYGFGGALIVGAAIAYIVTSPKSETSVIRTTRATPTVAPAPGGAVVGGMWSF